MHMEAPGMSGPHHPATAGTAAAVAAALRGGDSVDCANERGVPAAAHRASSSGRPDTVYGGRFCGGFQRFRHSEDLADVTVVVELEQLGADRSKSAQPPSEHRLHSLLLAYHSGFFQVGMAEHGACS